VENMERGGVPGKGGEDLLLCRVSVRQQQYLNCIEQVEKKKKRGTKKETTALRKDILDLLSLDMGYEKKECQEGG